MWVSVVRLPTSLMLAPKRIPPLAFITWWLLQIFIELALCLGRIAVKFWIHSAPRRADENDIGKGAAGKDLGKGNRGNSHIISLCRNSCFFDLWFVVHIARLARFNYDWLSLPVDMKVMLWYISLVYNKVAIYLFVVRTVVFNLIWTLINYSPIGGVPGLFSPGIGDRFRC